MIRASLSRRCPVLWRSAFSTAAPKFLPGAASPIVSKLDFFNSVTGGAAKIPTYRVLDSAGKPLEGAELPDIDRELARELYDKMQLLPTLDTVLYNIQRQGKISFYVTSHGEEATIIGSAAALAMDDEVLGQYRELGVLLWRGFTLDAVMAQCFGNEDDTSGKGRQMPVHFGSPTHHFHTISSPLSTQIPQAAGVAFALKRSRPQSIAACYFGEGAASEGDFHAGMMFASTIPSPTLFIARNNGFAISTPISEQYYGDGIASRGPGYGMDTVRVDGNDILAVISATREARRRCVEEGRPVLIEAMTYRVGHHSTSDDSFAYRARAEVEDRKRVDNPITRFRLFMESRGWWSAEDEEELKARLKDDVMRALKRADGKKYGPLGQLFTDIYGGEEPWNITAQREELRGLLRKYGESYEPWRMELAKFRHAGKDVIGQEGS